MAELSALGLFFLLLIIINHAGEFAADSAAARIGLGDALISALQGFGDDYGYNRVSETHPSIRARIARLISQTRNGGSIAAEPQRPDWWIPKQQLDD